MQLINIINMKKIIKVILKICTCTSMLYCSLVVLILIGAFAFVHLNKQGRDGNICLNDNWELLTEENAKKSCAAEMIQMPTAKNGDLPLVLARYGRCEADALLVFHASDEWIEAVVRQYNMTPYRPMYSHADIQNASDEKSEELVRNDVLKRINNHQKFGLPQLDDLIASGTWEAYNEVRISHTKCDAQRNVTLSMMVDKKQHVVVCKFLFQ